MRTGCIKNTQYISLQQHLLVTVCCITLCFFVACSHVAARLSDKDTAEHAIIEKYYQQKQYQESLEHCMLFIARYPKSSLYDRVLYVTALNHIQIDSLHGDYTTALRYFTRLAEECRNSSLRNESAAWIALLSQVGTDTARMEKALLEKQEQVIRCQQTIDQRDRDIVKLKTEVEKITKEIDLLKKVDLQFQQKKKDVQNAVKP
jgi:tetratricopeptide (TPR) repeat protein